MEDKILIVDLETTGFSASKDHIVEIGLVELDLMTGKKITLYDELISPPMEIEDIEKSWVVTKGYINALDIVFGRPLDEALPQLQNLIDLYPLGITAFNNSFDFGFLEYYGIEFIKKLPCPMHLSTNICKFPGYSGIKLKRPSCEQAYNFYFPGAEWVELHRGADDAWHEADIVKKLYDMGVFKLD